MSRCHCQRDSEGWPVLMVETEVIGDSKRRNDRDSSLVGSLDSSCRYNRFFFPALAALVSPVQNIIFLTVHLFTLLVPFAQQPGQAGVLGRLSLCLSSPTPTTHFLFNTFPSLARTFFYAFILTFFSSSFLYLQNCCFLRSMV
jgi:hypothetical protein